MDTTGKVVRIYLSAVGESPFEQWFISLSDNRTRQRILARIARVRAGNLGDWKSLGVGAYEMRIDCGPGYRLYFGLEGSKIVILLAGGDKRTQDRDIKHAKEYWYDYQKRKEARNF